MNPSSAALQILLLVACHHAPDNRAALLRADLSADHFEGKRRLGAGEGASRTRVGCLIPVKKRLTSTCNAMSSRGQL